MGCLMGIFENGRIVEKSAELPGAVERRAESGERLMECCRSAIDLHAAYNQMMVCPECKQIIKCFSDERAFRNYQKFCLSRHRKFITVPYQGMNVLIFKAYDGYSS